MRSAACRVAARRDRRRMSAISPLAKAVSANSAIPKKIANGHPNSGWVARRSVT